MRTTTLLNQHKRCECLLKMIEKCDRRINTYRQTTESLKRAGLSPSEIDWYYKQWQITLNIKERLVSAYSNALKQIVSPVINKIIA